MSFIGPTQVAVRVDKYTRSTGAVGALTVLPAKDIESVGLQLPTHEVVTAAGLAEAFRYMARTGKRQMPDFTIVTKVDVTSAGVPAATGAFGLLGRPEEPGHSSRTIQVNITSGMHVTWEFFQESAQPDLPDAGFIRFTHVLKHADGTAPVFVGF